jgi:hypothetical protein
MHTLAVETKPSALDIEITEDELLARLVDGRTITVPLVWFPRLLHATPQQRQNWELNGEGIHWPDVDEDLSVRGLLRGVTGLGVP